MEKVLGVVAIIFLGALIVKNLNEMRLIETRTTQDCKQVMANVNIQLLVSFVLISMVVFGGII